MSLKHLTPAFRKSSLSTITDKRQQGFTLIEILVAVVILSVGMLGIASLQVQGLRNNQSAFLRSQATLLAYDIADRIRTNSARAIAGDYDDFDTKGALPSDPACISSATGCTDENLATTDLIEWANSVNGSGGTAAILPDAQGLIERGANNSFTISINWKETQYDSVTGNKQVTTESFSTSFNL